MGVTVRVEPELVKRLDALATRTNWGAYLRMALWAALPFLERMHWAQVAADFDDLAIKDAFEEIALGLMENALKKIASKRPGRTPPARQTRTRTRSDGPGNQKKEHHAKRNRFQPRVLP